MKWIDVRSGLSFRSDDVTGIIRFVKTSRVDVNAFNGLIVTAGVDRL